MIKNEQLLVRFGPLYLSGFKLRVSNVGSPACDNNVDLNDQGARL